MASMHQQLMARVMSAPAPARAIFSSAPATPDSLAGLVAWGEGSDLGADGTAIASWLNKTGSGLDPAQATAGNRPIVTANAINGQKAAKFITANATLLDFPAGSLGWFNAVPGATFAAVVSLVSATATNQHILNAAANVGIASRMSLLWINTPTWGSTTASGADVTNGTLVATPPPTPAVGVPVILVGTVNWVAGVRTISVNGAIAGNGTFTGSASGPTTDSSGIRIGARGVGSNFADMYVGAYAMWNVAYSRWQLAGVLSRWATLYGIRLTG